jgi:hypothetical protein
LHQGDHAKAVAQVLNVITLSRTNEDAVGANWEKAHIIYKIGE